MSCFPSLHLRHSSLSNPSVDLPTSQLILQPFRCFTYVTAHSPTLLSFLLSHKIFTYVTWRAAHGKLLTSLLKDANVRQHLMSIERELQHPEDELRMMWNRETFCDKVWKVLRYAVKVCLSCDSQIGSACCGDCDPPVSATF